MTDYQRARRARKSRTFFAKVAERAALAGNRKEAERLLTQAIYKTAEMHTATACHVVATLDLAA